jgi:hypothetical protein
VPVAPAPVRVGSVPRLVYELCVRNNAHPTTSIFRLEVVRVDATAERIATVKDRSFVPHRPPRTGPVARTVRHRRGPLGNGSPLAADYARSHSPTEILHKLTVEFPAHGPSVATIMGLRSSLTAMIQVLARWGGPWWRSTIPSYR